MRLTRLCLTSLWATLGIVREAYTSSPVKVRLRSSWPAPNLLLEILESAALEYEPSFFSVLDLLTSPETFSSSFSSLSDKEVYDISVRTLLKNGYLSEPGALDTFELSLALHTSSPKIEAYYDYYRDHDLSQVVQAAGEEPGDCTGSWVFWYGQRVCTVKMLRHLVETEQQDRGREEPKLLSFDHIYPPTVGSLDQPSRTAILYGSLSTSSFRSLHEYLYSIATETRPRLKYIFRHIPPEAGQFSHNYLSGYGVTMDLKKMDYLALDDRHHGRGRKEGVEHSSRSDGNISGRSESTFNALDVLGDINEDVDLVTALTKEEITNVSVQATQLIMMSAQPLRTLIDLSQNFPKYATSLARRISVKDNLLSELEGNWRKIQDGFAAVWLNGMILQNSDVSVFGLLRLLRQEREIMAQMTALGLSAPQAIDLLTHDAMISAQAGNPVIDGLFDASDRREGGDTILWWNNIEKDTRYRTWSPNVQALLQPMMFPGQFPQVRRNMYNIILALDLSQRNSLAWIAGPVFNIIQRGLPFRFGVVPIVETEDSEKAARLFYYVVHTFGRSKAMEYIKKVFQGQNSGAAVDFNLARIEYDALVLEADNSLQVNKGEGEDGTSTYFTFDEIIRSSSGDDSDDTINAIIEQARAYAKRLSVTLKSSPQGHAFINGKHSSLSDDFLNILQTETAQQTQFLQEKIHVGDITDDTDMSVFFYDLPTTVSRRNRYIYPLGQRGNLKVANIPEVLSRTGLEVSAADFVYPSGNIYPLVSIWIVSNFDASSGALLLKEALRSLHKNSTYRIAFAHNPPEGAIVRPDTLSYRLSKLHAAGLFNRTTPDNILALLEQSHEHVNSDQSVLSEDSSQLPILSQSDLDLTTHYDSFQRFGRTLARELGVGASVDSIFVNGRIIGPIEEDTFTSEDFELLADYEISKRVGPVVEAYTNVTGLTMDDVGIKYSDDIAKLSSVMLSVQIPDPSQEGLFNAPQRPRNRRYLLLDHWKSSFTFGDNSTASYQIAFILDPASEVASKWSPLIQWLASIDTVYVQVFLNPAASLEELPVKQFYRFSLPHRLAFDNTGFELVPTIEFTNLPPDPIYTLGMDVPQAWLVRPNISHHDLDNIHLASFTGLDENEGVEAIFSLDYIVVEGHARESPTNSPPRGLQLQLSTSNSTPIADTQVVANLGYIQFKAKPGVFQLEIREGYGREVFEIESVGNEGWNSPPVTSVGNEITVTSLEGLTLYPRLRKRPGMELADVLREPLKERPSNVVDQMMAGISSIFRTKKEKEVDVKSDKAEINIFTVASGLLYERFVGIMILSVLRNTNSTVKFWFIENFLSPSFLEFIPHLAKAYNFQYELVTYKWPSWLRAQKEKQRVIWGYKILFLDVLFPMDLKKVIFVDADQIVRADLKELVNLDLQGAPYGYTPMGDDNYEMEGFRFWKTGYWRDFLRGRPYHISALYVIDLVRFRQLAAGDRLRGSYQGLSADPNSLANLDQDLPNNLQFEVPIFSLPEDWLWCETWCSKDRLYRAKTIDLCQNPMTKEPKLSRARQIPEWEEYDNEISQFARKLAEQGLIRSAAYATGVDDLANVGSKAPASSKIEEVDISGMNAIPASESQEAQAVKEEIGTSASPPRDEL